MRKKDYIAWLAGAAMVILWGTSIVWLVISWITEP